MTEEEQGALKRHTQAGSRLHVIPADLRKSHQELKKKDPIKARTKLQRQEAGPHTQTHALLKLQKSRENFTAYVVAKTTLSSRFSGTSHGAGRWLNYMQTLFLWITHTMHILFFAFI